jgi:hypothetical protein
VTATDNSTPPLTVTAKTTVVAPPVVATQLALNLPATVTVGVAVPLKVIPEDAHGQPVPNYSGTVTLTGDSNTTFSSNTITFGNGAPASTAPVTVTFAAVGPESVTATDNSTPLLTVTAKTTVVAPPVVATQLQLNLPASVTVGVAVPLKVVPESAQGQPVLNYSGTVTLSGDSNATFSSTTITFANGAPANTAPVTVTFAAVGAESVTATDNSTPPLTATTKTTVVAAPVVATQLVLNLPASVTAGVAVPLKVVPENAQGQPVLNYSGTVTLSGDSNATFSSTTITFANGVPSNTAPVTVTFAAVGAESVTATDNSTPPLTVTAKTTVVAPPVVATQLVLNLPARVTVGVAVPLSVIPENAQGQPVPSYSGTVTLSGDSNATFSAKTITFANGVPTNTAPVTVTFAAVGTESVTATDNSTPPLTVTAKTAVVAPVPLPATSSNWSGYAMETKLSSPQTASVSAVGGTWNVPAVTGSGTNYCAVWVGIDGYSSPSVEQIGTASDVVKGKAQYFVWYEMYPQGSVEISLMAVSPGDSITASVTYLTSGANAGQFQLSIADTSRANDSFTTFQGGPVVARSSAEWIVEAPSSSSGGVLPLANFGTVTFAKATATINGTSGPIDGAKWQAAEITMVSGSTVEASPSALTDSGATSSFTVKYVSSVSGSSGNTVTGEISVSPQAGNLTTLSAAAGQSAAQSDSKKDAYLLARERLFAHLEMLFF